MKEKLNDSIKQEKKRKKKCEVSKMCFFPCELVKLTLYFLYFFYSTLMPPKSDKGEKKTMLIRVDRREERVTVMDIS